MATYFRFCDIITISTAIDAWAGGGVPIAELVAEFCALFFAVVCRDIRIVPGGLK